MSLDRERGVIHIEPPIDKKIVFDNKGASSSDPVVRLLSGPRAVNFSSVAESIDLNTMSPDVLTEIRLAAGEKVINTLFAGHFADLRGANLLLDKIGISIEFPEEFYQDINDLLPKLDLLALSRLGCSQPCCIGEYNLGGARKILEANGFSKEELSNGAVIKILNYRHILIYLKESQVQNNQLQEMMPNLLETGKLELPLV